MRFFTQVHTPDSAPGRNMVQEHLNEYFSDYVPNMPISKNEFITHVAKRMKGPDDGVVHAFNLLKQYRFRQVSRSTGNQIVWE